MPIPTHPSKRIWNKFLVGDGCWEWTGFRDKGGYGQIATGPAGGQKKRAAHRVVYETVVALVPDELDMDHLCRNHGCVNPGHLEPVTHRENMLRGSGAKKTHCPIGHEYTLENTANYGKGRICRECYRERNRKFQRGRRERARI